MTYERRSLVVANIQAFPHGEEASAKSPIKTDDILRFFRVIATGINNSNKSSCNAYISTSSNPILAEAIWYLDQPAGELLAVKGIRIKADANKLDLEDRTDGDTLKSHYLEKILSSITFLDDIYQREAAMPGRIKVVFDKKHTEKNEYTINDRLVFEIVKSARKLFFNTKPIEIQLFYHNREKIVRINPTTTNDFKDRYNQYTGYFYVHSQNISNCKVEVAEKENVNKSISAEYEFELKDILLEAMRTRNLIEINYQKVGRFVNGVFTVKRLDIIDVLKVSDSPIRSIFDD